MRYCDQTIIPSLQIFAAIRDGAKYTRKGRGSIKFSGVVYQIDHTPVDVLVRDLRRTDLRTKSKEIRPLLTLILDSRSRLVVGAQFGYDKPDHFTVAAAIRDSLIVSEEQSNWYLFG